MSFVESRSLNISIVLHALAILIAFVGLPAILPEKTEPQPLVMSVEILPITGVTNVKPSDKAIEKEQKAPTPKTPKPVEPTAKEPPKPSAPAPLKPPTPAKESAPAEKHFDPNEGAEELPDAKKEKKEPPKPPEPDKPKEQPKKEDAKPKADEFAALLNKLKQENTTSPSKDAKDKTNTTENKTKSDAPYNPELPMSLSEKDAIQGQFIPCWRMPAGAKDAGNLAVRVKVEVTQDGAVKTAAVASDQQSRYASDPYFRAAADSAVRAVYKCSPLKNLPPEKFGTWKSMELNFDPKEMM